MFINLYFKKDFANRISIILLSLILTGTLCIFALTNASKETPQEGQNSGVGVPILMYHGLVKNAKNQNKFLIDPKLLEDDFEYMKSNDIVPVFVEDLVKYVEENAELPEKPILITFDDGYYNNYLYAYSLAKKYMFKIIISPIGKCVDEYSKINDENELYSYLTWSNIEEMVKSGFVEIQNHSYNMHSKGKGSIGCKKRKDESLEKYKERLKKDLQKEQDLIFEHTGKYPTTFVYPFGAFSKETPDILEEMGFKSTFLCYDKINHVSKDPKCLRKLCRFIRPNNTSSKDFFSKIYKNCNHSALK